MTDKNKPNEKVSFLRAASEKLCTIADIIAKTINYVPSKGLQLLCSDTEAEKTLNVLSEQISVANELIHETQKRLPHRIVNRSLMFLYFLSNLLGAGQQFIELAKAEGDAERIEGYIYDTWEALCHNDGSLRPYAGKLSNAANVIQNGSRSKKRKTQKEKGEMLLSCLSSLALRLYFMATDIDSFELPQGNRKDYAAMVAWLRLKHEIYEVRDALSYAKENTSHPSIEEAEVLLELVYKYMGFDLDQFHIIEIPDVRDEIVDSVTMYFSIANECCFELDKVVVRLQLLEQATRDRLRKVGSIITDQSIKPVKGPGEECETRVTEAYTLPAKPVEMEQLKVIQRQFEQWTSNYPVLSHLLILYPASNKRPDEEIIESFHHNLCRMWYDLPGERYESGKRMVHFLFKAKQQPWDVQKGTEIFYTLADRAVRIIRKTGCGNSMKNVSGWLLLLHILGQPKRDDDFTCSLDLKPVKYIQSDDGFVTVQNACHLVYERGGQISGLDDVFLESAVVCTHLLEKDLRGNEKICALVPDISVVERFYGQVKPESSAGDVEKPAVTEHKIEPVKETKKNSWKPPKGYIGSKTIVNDYDIPRSTLEGWQQQDNVPVGELEGKVKKDPQTQECYFPKKWFNKRLKNYRPRNHKT